MYTKIDSYYVWEHIKGHTATSYTLAIKISLTFKTTGHILCFMKDIKKITYTKEKLLETGIRLFSEHGYHGTGIKEIVDASGIPKGSFYNYFDSKEEFAAEIVLHYAQMNSARWADYLARGPEDNAFERLYKSFELMIENHEASDIKTGCLVGNLAGELAESSELCRATLRSTTAAWCQRLAYHLGQAQLQGTVRQDLNAEELAEFCWNAWEGCLLRMKIENSTEPVRQCIANLFNGFLKP